MPVNYLSKPVVPQSINPYVNPLDLNLLAKVNTYKQSQFYQNAQKVNDQLGALQGLDIANPVQREYLDSAINSVTKKINDFGGIDYSDVGVANSVENLANEVSGDENVINGIASTKKIRDLQSNYQKMASDPKLSKYYNPAYETYDYEHYIKPYISSDNLQASYEGPLNPTIYTGNPLDRAAKLIKQAHPEITTEVVNGQATGGYINTITHEHYTPEQLSSTFDSLIDGQLKTELQKNAWYTLDYSNRKADGTPVYGENDYTEMLSTQANKQLQNLQSELKAQQYTVLNAGLDYNAKDRAQKRAVEITEQIANLKSNTKQNEDAFRNTFRKDKDSALYQLYVNGIKHDLYDVFGADQQKVTLKADLNQLYEHQKEIAYINKKMIYKGKNPDGTDNVQPMVQPDGEGILSPFTAMQSNTETDSEAAAHALNVEKIKVDNQAANDAVSDSLKQLIYKEAIAHKDDNGGVGNLYQALGFSASMTNDANSAPIVGASPLLNYIAGLDKSTTNPTNNKDNLDIADFRQVVQHPTMALNMGLSQQALTYMQGLVKSYDHVVSNVDYDQPITKGVQEFVDLYKEKMQLVNANNTLFENAKKAAISELTGGKTLTPKQKADLDYIQQNGLDLFVRTGGKELDPKFLTVLNKLGYHKGDDFGHTFGNPVNDLINKHLKNASNRENYLKIYFDTPEQTDKLKTLLPGLTNFITDNAKPEILGQKIPFDKVSANNVYMTPNGTWKLSFNVESGGALLSSDPTGSLKGGLKDLTLTPEQAQRIGAQSLPYPDFEKTADIMGEAQKDYTPANFYNIKTDGSVAKNTTPVQIKVYTDNNSRNNRFFVPKVHDPVTDKWITIPYTGDATKYGVSANGAYRYATEKINAYATTTVPGYGVQAKDKDGNTIIVKNISDFIKNLPKE